MRKQSKPILILLLCLGVLVLPGVMVQAEDVRANTDTRRDGLIGPVESVYVEMAAFENRNGRAIEQPRIPVELYRYDQKGNRVGRRTYKEDGSLATEEVRTYDSAGRRVEEAKYRGNGVLDCRWVYTYDAQGNVIEQVGQRQDGSLVGRSVFTYDVAAKAASVDVYLYGKTPSYTRIVDKYDANGNNIERTSYRADNTIEWKSVRLLGPSGEVVEIQDYGEGNILKTKSMYVYDAAGRKLEETVYSYKRGDSTAILQSRTTYNYDVMGRLIEERRYNGSGSVVVAFTYEVDSVGNWVKKTMLMPVAGANGLLLEPVESIYRTIRYYSETP